MKVCEYCGRQTEEQATYCTGCGTSFETEPAAKPFDIAHWARHSASGLALTSGAGALFISGGIFLGLSKVVADLSSAGPWDGPKGPGFGVSFCLPKVLTWVLLIGTAAFTFAVCVARCREKWQGYTIAAITILTAFVATLIPVMMLLLPSLFLGVLTGSSAGFYVGLLFQFFAGAWLLHWIGRRTAENEMSEA